MKATEKPQKPYPDFPLFPHARGKWAKKVNGSLKYFGKWEDPEGALREYRAWVDSQVLPHVTQPDGLTIKQGVNLYLNQRRSDVKTGKLASRSFVDYKRSVVHFAKFVGVARTVDSLKPEDFSRYMNDFSARTNPVNAGNEATRIRTALNWLVKKKHVRPVDYGPDFKKPSRKIERRYRRKRGVLLYESSEIQAILRECNPRLRATVFLGINCAYQNDDIEWITVEVAEKALQTGIIELPREKTEIERGCPLWAETSEALRTWLEMRPQWESNRLFCRYDGKPFTPMNAEVGKQFRYLRDMSGVKRGGFSWLRKTFSTYASECADQVAVDTIMGHVDNSIPGLYRQLVREKRLHKATEAVHTWLFGTPTHLK